MMPVQNSFTISPGALCECALISELYAWFVALISAY